MREILTAGRYFRQKFGCNVYKTPISILGFTCPNIDGTVARGGCVFCENESFSPNLGVQKIDKKFLLNPSSASNPFLSSQLVQLEGQYNLTRKKLEKKFNAKKFLVYFQSFTNTYAPFDTLKALYEKALSFEDVIGLSIGTRTDSISEEVLDYLAEKSKTKEIWVEYGIQSVYDETLQRINRGHSVQNVIDYITLTKQKGIKVCAHLIFGLPGETQEMMLESVKKAIELGVESIKIHPLYVVKRTALANDFKAKRFTPISEQEYIDTLLKTFEMIPEKMMVQRISAGVSDETLLAPKWCENKHKQMFNIKQAIKQKGFVY
ncbi:MAG TPA: TIGR01212 family radical SAM protein [Sulfurospirillum sp. UBA12182]|nr:MAG TPA: TIGR01212 family radical SAM protein [Sulfurospirillum sp. UBA12182]